MLSNDTFGLKHIRELQSYSGRDPILIERVLYAFGLLEALVRVKMPFIFKGGSVVTKEIKNELLIVDDKERCMVTLPNVNCILGDKLTAFAPHTTGIPIGVGKEQEIMKQLFDVAILVDVIDDFAEVKETYKRIAAEEIAYRGLDITYKESLMDTIRSASCIIGKGHTDKKEFTQYMSGAKAVGNHIFQEKYSGEKATFQACKVLCLAAYVLADKDYMVHIEHPENYIDAKIPLREFSKLSYIKKLKLEAYGYLVEGIKVLEKTEIT